MIRKWISQHLLPIVCMIAALVLTIAPMPNWASPFRPDWLALTLIYLAMTSPHTYSIGTAWIVGIVLDVTQGTPLGQHAIALCFVSYITVKFHLQLRIFPIFQMSVTVFVILSFYQLILFLDQWYRWGECTCCDLLGICCYERIDLATVDTVFHQCVLPSEPKKPVHILFMKLLEPIKNEHLERRMFIGRIVLSVIIGLLLFSSVIIRLVQLQIVDHELLSKKAQNNHIRIETIPPTRGLIFDRKGRILAENIPIYQLVLIPEQVTNLDETLNRLAKIQLINKEEIPRIRSLSLSGPQFKSITLRFLLSQTEISQFATQRPHFPGVDFLPRLMRYYPHGKNVAHVLGYVGAIDTTDLTKLDPTAYVGTAYTGKTGVEIKFESDLHGNPGHQRIVTNAHGRQIPSNSRKLSFSLLEKESLIPGANLYLSVDLDLQILATEILAGHRGSIVAINPNNGEILALVSAPTFDPNIFVKGMSTDAFGALKSNVEHPLFNRAVQGTYPPGSTIKPMLALAALEIGATNLTRRNFCRGFYTLPKSTHRYRDWKPEGHGAINLHDAIAQSCDVYFYEISTAIGIDQMHFYLDQFGFGQYTSMDIANEHRGLLPSRDWKRRNFREPEDQLWFPGETVIASIGQGYMLATPLQLANATAILATKGKRFEPRIVVAIENPLTNTKKIIPPNRLHDVEISNDIYWQSVISAMHDVMQNNKGTAWAAGRDATYKMAGKSGTAQVFSVAQKENYKEKEIKEHLRDHALFISFAPLENPKIAVAVVIENGSSGSGVAAPIARVIMDSYLGVNPNVL